MSRLLSKDRLKCLTCPDYCKYGSCTEKGSFTSESDATICSACVDGHYVMNDKCGDCSSGCRNCTNDLICNECFPRYALKDTPKECSPCPSSCETCIWNVDKTECTKCMDRYVINDLKSCTSCGSYCKSCTQSKDTGVKCSTCDDIAFKDDTSKCNLCSLSIGGCQKCSDKSTCTECFSPGWTKTNDNKCAACSSIHSACMECEASSGTNKCTKCSSGYYVKSDSCQPCPRNCDTCEEKDNVATCTKCKIDYTLVNLKSCDRCPDNCDVCEVSGNSLICKQCSSRYALNTKSLCTKCPDNCKRCTYNAGNARTECDGTKENHQCEEMMSGKSWGKKMTDGTCVACPNNCEKCYFRSDTDSTPVCYASRCSMGNGFDDTTDTCYTCGTGCSYCKKVAGVNHCIKCQSNYVMDPVDDTCKQCSQSQCDYCEIENSVVKCRKSGCATPKKFEFTSKTCSGNCASDSSCMNGQTNIFDENEVCFCRDCPAGSAVILKGSNAGVCKSCGTNCEDCILTSDQMDVKCNTCKDKTQWLQVEIGGTLKWGCYDCTIARPHCAILEMSGSTCRCKATKCIGDQSESVSATAKRTVWQDVSPDTYQKCSSCQDLSEKTLWCTAVANGNTWTLTRTDCRDGFGLNTNVGTGTEKCLIKNAGCLVPDLATGVDVNKCDTTIKCAPGYYFETDICKACSTISSDCEECVFSGAAKCVKCKAGKYGSDCSSTTECSPVSTNCATGFSYPDGASCYCTRCVSSTNLKGTFSPTLNAEKRFDTAGCIASGGAGEIATAIANCASHETPDLCAYCETGYDLISTDKKSCLTNVADCTPGYSFNDGAAKCRMASGHNFIEGDVPIAVSANFQAPGCLLYSVINAATTPVGDKVRCTQCPSGKMIEVDHDTNAYKCTDCVLAGKANCAFAVPHKGSCYCGKCIPNTGSNYYIMKSDMSECVDCNSITSCTAYTLRLKGGSEICACKSCSSGILNLDSTQCVDCSAQSCSSGTVKVDSSNSCYCSCPANFKLNANKNGCIDCSSVKAACQNNEDKVVLTSSDTCECSECGVNNVLNTLKMGCVDCQNTAIGGKTNCKMCTIDTSDQITACTSCVNGYTLLASGTCKKCETGCDVCKSDSADSVVSQCTKCSSGYVIDGAGKCVQCPQSPVACSSCRIDPKDKTNALCLQFQCTNGVALRDLDFRCDSCTSTISNCKHCVKNIEGAYKCVHCNSGYYLKSETECATCGTNCEFCVDGSGCMPNGCKMGYIRHRTDGSCLQCTGVGVERCAYLDATSDTTVPKICQSGYVLNVVASPNVCDKCDSNCLSCVTQLKDKCDPGKCKSGYYHNSGDNKCYQNKANCLVSIRLNGLTVCSACSSVRTLSENDCKDCPTGCESCSFDSEKNKFTCSSCMSLYYKNADETCSECPTGCSKCNLNNGAVECTECMSKYGLKGVACELCVVDQCQTCETDALNNNNLVCKTCSSKFYLNSDDCGECPKWCHECSYNNKYECTKCYTRYAKIPSDGTCAPCPTNCDTCTGSSDGSTRCTKCVSDAYSLMPDGTCSPCNDAAFSNCARCGPTTTTLTKAECMQCGSGYTLQDDKLACVLCNIDGCGTCAHGSLCSKCKEGHYLHNFNRECAFKCFSCTGTQADCGKSLESVTNETEVVKFQDCGIGGCWSYRTEEGSSITYSRGCNNLTCTEESKYEECQTGSDGKRQCSKCCENDKCNTFELDGKAGASVIYASIFALLFGAIIQFF